MNSKQKYQLLFDKISQYHSGEKALQELLVQKKSKLERMLLCA
ncbi:hypothetical protein [Bacillus sp. FJAT-27231]|nr:hypothetical protein [Bacillus sp. FJAT-27231]